jgi:Flp pilus assembly protein TadG
MIYRRERKAIGWSSFLRLIRAREGNVAVEFALILPATVLLLSGLIEYGVVTYDSTSVENAARAGAQYAFSGGYSKEKVDATVRAASAVYLGPDDKVDSSIACECTDGTSITCGDTCDNGGPNRRFIKVNVTKNHEAWLPLMDHLVPDKVYGSATIRMQ